MPRLHSGTSKDGPETWRIVNETSKYDPRKGTTKVTLLNEIPGVIQSNAGPSIKGNAASIFLKSTQGKTKVKAEPSECPKGFIGLVV